MRKARGSRIGKGCACQLEGSIPADWQVLVLADRGMSARWLFQTICACGWHPFLRINLGVKARTMGEEVFDWIGRWTPTPGTCWKGEVECFAGKASRLRCTLLMHWEAGYEHPWAILTDLKTEQVTFFRGPRDLARMVPVPQEELRARGHLLGLATGVIPGHPGVASTRAGTSAMACIPRR